MQSNNSSTLSSQIKVLNKCIFRFFLSQQWNWPVSSFLKTSVKCSPASSPQSRKSYTTRWSCSGMTALERTHSWNFRTFAGRRTITGASTVSSSRSQILLCSHPRSQCIPTFQRSGWSARPSPHMSRKKGRRRRRTAANVLCDTCARSLRGSEQIVRRWCTAEIVFEMGTDAQVQLKWDEDVPFVAGVSEGFPSFNRVSDGSMEP